MWLTCVTVSVCVSLKAWLVCDAAERRVPSHLGIPHAKNCLVALRALGGAGANENASIKERHVRSAQHIAAAWSTLDVIARIAPRPSTVAQPSCPSKSGRGSIAPARRVVRRASGLRSRSNGAASRPALACKCRGAEACDALPSLDVIARIARQRIAVDQFSGGPKQPDLMYPEVLAP